MKTIQEDWNHMAEAYEEFNAAADSYSCNIEWPAIRGVLPPVEGKRVLDVGCGTGIFTFLLEGCRPRTLVGLDLSEAMLGLAREKAARRGSAAAFVLGDAARADAYVQGAFDLIFSSTTSHYIRDLNGLFRSLERCMADGGCMVFSIIHPVYSAMYPVEHGERFPEDEAWQIRYLDRRDRAYIQPWIEYNDHYENRLSRSCHHTLGDYFAAIHAAGLWVERLEEPLPPEGWRADSPGRYEGYIETPVYMLLKLRRRGEKESG